MIKSLNVENTMDQLSKNWKRMCFKGQEVWVALDAQGLPEIREGKVLIKYQLNQEYEYRVHESNIHPLDSSVPKSRYKKPEAGRTASKGDPADEHQNNSPQNIDTDTILIYTDGASSGNPGPAGIGILLRHKGREKEVSRFIGETTNNVAELQAIQTALEELKSVHLPVRLFTDSTYAQGVLSLGWKAKKNEALIRSVKDLMAKFKDLKILHVMGHKGEEGNERANRLAVSAAKSRGK